MTNTIFILMLVAGAGGPSPVVFPEQRIPLRFSHALHLKKDIACDYCHEKAPESTRSSDFLIPTESTCSDCHAIDRANPTKQAKPAARCDACHVGFEPGHDVQRVVIAPPHLKFNHKIHISQNIQCTECHGDMRQLDLATREQLPSMTLCLKCHNGAGKLKAPSQCSTCHLTGPSGTMQTSFTEGKLAPSGVLRGDAHTPTFRRDHASVARNDERYCLNCHRKDECLSCHNGVMKPFDIHGNDYVLIHPIEARRDNMKCQSCHRLQTFCVGCHQRTGVGLDVPGGVPKGPQTSSLHFHPDGWVTALYVTNPNHHAWQAMRNIRTCVACHREETCIECHSSTSFKTGGAFPGTSPHPPDWTTGGRCKALAARNKRVCLKCHATTETMALSCM
jgi:c(7)-type cytochrome triheme protein